MKTETCHETLSSTTDRVWGPSNEPDPGPPMWEWRTCIVSDSPGLDEPPLQPLHVKEAQQPHNPQCCHYGMLSEMVEQSSEGARSCSYTGALIQAESNIMPR